MRNMVFATIAGLVACTHPNRQSSLGVREHMAEAERCEKEAKVHDTQAAVAETAQQKRDWVCGDTVLQDQATSGGKPLIPSTPCWSPGGEEAARQRAAADRLYADAAVHRTLAHQIAEAERNACATLSSSELDHSPFLHKADIARVSAELDGDRVTGARIVFRQVPGLTATWLRGAIGCFQARSAVFGHDPTYFGYDPTLVDGADVTVTTEDGAIVVTATAADPGAALAIYGRAEDLLK